MSENKIQEIKEKMDLYVSKLCQELKEGHTDSFKQYLKVIASFHRYSFGNQMLIAMQKPEATRVAGFQTWKSMGRYVKKGEKAIKILAPISKKRVVKKADGSEEEKKSLWFRAVSVFDISQTEGDEIPDALNQAGKDNFGIYTKLKAALEARNIRVDEGNLPLGVYGVSYGDRIEIAPWLEPKTRALVLIHEAAHSLLHRGSENASLSRGFKECQAEATAYIVANYFGETSEMSRDYLLNWGNTEKELKENLSAVIKASQEIIEMLSEIKEESDNVESEEEELIAA